MLEIGCEVWFPSSHDLYDRMSLTKCQADPRDTYNLWTFTPDHLTQCDTI
jgi:hypothetical protein